MGAERHIISGYGLCKITVDGSVYFFDVIKYEMVPNEIQDRDRNLFGTLKNKVIAYEPVWNLLLCTLIPNTNVTPNISKTGNNIYDFVNKYHAMSDQQKIFTIVPVYGTDSTFAETNNRTSFEVMSQKGKPPIVIPYKGTNRKLGNVLSIKAEIVRQIPYDEFQYFYRNTSDGLWYNTGQIVTAEVRKTTDITWEFRSGGTDVNAEFKTGN